MTAHHQTLLAKLAPKFGPQTENLAVDRSTDTTPPISPHVVCHQPRSAAAVG